LVGEGEGTAVGPSAAAVNESGCVDIGTPSDQAATAAEAAAEAAETAPGAVARGLEACHVNSVEFTAVASPDLLAALLPAAGRITLSSEAMVSVGNC
jgi:hypothetical protein